MSATQHDGRRDNRAVNPREDGEPSVVVTCTFHRDARCCWWMDLRPHLLQKECPPGELESFRCCGADLQLQRRKTTPRGRDGRDARLQEAAASAKRSGSRDGHSTCLYREKKLN